MNLFVFGVFGVVYISMVLGRIPGLALDRTGVALLGVIALLAAGAVHTAEVWDAVDTPTIALLFALMVVSSQFRLAGFYSYVVQRLAKTEVSPPALLALFIGAVAVLSALLANDIICLAMAPILIEVCARRGLNPKPFLFGLACAANVGSAATLIGNPQNMLIGQVLHVPFGGYLLIAGPPTLLGLAAVWIVICRAGRGRWRRETRLPEVAAPTFDLRQTVKGAAVIAAIVAAFLFADWPREIAALAAAGILLCSRRMRSREMLGLVDWQLIVLFISLFVLNRAMQTSGNLGEVEAGLSALGVDPQSPGWLFGIAALLSNVVSNVPAVMLLLPSAVHPLSGPILALSSTLAGNLFIVGSIANIIVVDQAARLGVEITWREHARVGVPVTLITLAIAAAWLAVYAAL